MTLFGLMRRFTIRFRMIGAIGVVLALLGLLGGAGMLGMFRLHEMSQVFVKNEYVAIGHLAQLRGEMGEIRQQEKNMIIQYERPENVKEAHTQWLAALDKAKKVVAELQQTDAGAQENTAANIAKQLDSYKEQFAHVARQLEAGGYDSATIANRMSVRAVNEFAGPPSWWTAWTSACAPKCRT